MYGKLRCNYNTVDDLLEFFDIPDRPVTPSEFTTFWFSLSEDEKYYYQTVPLR